MILAMVLHDYCMELSDTTGQCDLLRYLSAISRNETTVGESVTWFDNHPLEWQIDNVKAANIHLPQQKFIEESLLLRLLSVLAMGSKINNPFKG